MTWQPIDDYLAMPRKKRPKLCVFRYAPTEPNRPGGSILCETYHLTYPFGLRVCTHFKEIEVLDK
jgi:hypothetical protein